jgi:hypothetical protein
MMPESIDPVYNDKYDTFLRLHDRLQVSDMPYMKQLNDAFPYPPPISCRLVASPDLPLITYAIFISSY